MSHLPLSSCVGEEMSTWNRDFVFVIHQFLQENNFTDTMHKLEQESGFFFQFDYVKEKGMAGDWDEVERYLSGFIKIDERDDGSSKKMYYLIRRQKYLEALWICDIQKAIDVLNKDLKDLFDDDDEKYKELLMLLNEHNFGKSKKISEYGDTIYSIRYITMSKLKKHIDRNPSLQFRLQCPRMPKSRLKTLFQQSVSWQHLQCQNPKPNPAIETLLTDHTCSTPNSIPNMASSEIVVFAKCNIIIRYGIITDRIVRLLYTNAGDDLLILDSKGVQWLQPLTPHEIVTPDGRQLRPERIMDGSIFDPQGAVVPSLAISNNDHFLVSSNANKISWFELSPIPFKIILSTSIPPPPAAATCLAFHPSDNDVIAVGMKDASIYIYNIVTTEIIRILKGHRKHITGLSFSNMLKILVSSGADATLCFWSIDSWELLKSLSIRMPAGMEPHGVTKLQFRFDEVHLLICHDICLAIVDASKIKLIQQWVPPERMVSGSITSATYSCDGRLVYASFTDGIIAVLDAPNLRLRCRIISSAYLPRDMSSLFYRTKYGKDAYPLVVAAHPKKPNQLALGLSDGSVHIIEPSESGETWGSYKPSHS